MNPKLTTKQFAFAAKDLFINTMPKPWVMLSSAVSRLPHCEEKSPVYSRPRMVQIPVKTSCGRGEHTLIWFIICLLPTFHQKRTSNYMNLPTTDFAVMFAES